MGLKATLFEDPTICVEDAQGSSGKNIRVRFLEI